MGRGRLDVLLRGSGREKITMVFLTQLLPSSTHPIRRELRQLVAQAIVD